MYSWELADEVKYLKETEGGREHMCKILEEMCDEIAESAGLPLSDVEALAAQKTA